MYYIVAINDKNQKFEKQFESEYLFWKYLKKAEHSKKIKIISYGKKY